MALIVECILKSRRRISVNVIIAVRYKLIDINIIYLVITWKRNVVILQLNIKNVIFSRYIPFMYPLFRHIILSWINTAERKLTVFISLTIIA